MIKKITEISYSKINQNMYSLRNQIIHTSKKGNEQHAMMVEPIL